MMTSPPCGSFASRKPKSTVDIEFAERSRSAEVWVLATELEVLDVDESDKDKREAIV
jgi:hypothetical protein